MTSMTIGELAKRAGVNIETVRYYQRRGLLAEPPRPVRGFRKYPQEMLEHLRFIRRAKGLGFSLKEIEALLAIRRGRTRGSSDLVQFMSSKEQEIAKKIRDLEVKQRALQRLLREVRAVASSDRWKVFEANG